MYFGKDLLSCSLLIFVCDCGVSPVLHTVYMTSRKLVAKQADPAYILLDLSTLRFSRDDKEAVLSVLTYDLELLAVSKVTENEPDREQVANALKQVTQTATLSRLDSDLITAKILTLPVALYNPFTAALKCSDGVFTTYSPLQIAERGSLLYKTASGLFYLNGDQRIELIVCEESVTQVTKQIAAHSIL